MLTVTRFYNPVILIDFVLVAILLGCVVEKLYDAGLSVFFVWCWCLFYLKAAVRMDWRGSFYCVLTIVVGAHRLRLSDSGG